MIPDLDALERRLNEPDVPLAIFAPINLLIQRVREAEEQAARLGRKLAQVNDSYEAADAILREFHHRLEEFRDDR